MQDCPECGTSFETDHALHLHLGDVHEDRLTSHRREAVKKARREEERRREQAAAKRRQRRRRYGIALVAVLVVAVVGVATSQMLDVSSVPGTEPVALNLTGQPHMGAADAPVTVVGFGDYRCPFCARFERNVFPQLKKDYIDTGKVRFVFVNLAFLGPGSTQAAVAGECVTRQNTSAFWRFHTTLYTNQGPEAQQWVTMDRLLSAASSPGVDEDRLRQCINTRSTIDAVRADNTMAEAAGVTGTPAVMVEGRLLDGWDYSSIRTAIEAELP